MLMYSKKLKSNLDLSFKIKFFFKLNFKCVTFIFKCYINRQNIFSINVFAE